MNRCRPTGKVEYATAQDGGNALKRRTDAPARATHKHLTRGGSVYRCGHCHQWHLTHATHRHASITWPLLRNAVLERDLIEREREREAGA